MIDIQIFRSNVGISCLIGGARIKEHVISAVWRKLFFEMSARQIY